MEAREGRRGVRVGTTIKVVTFGNYFKGRVSKLVRNDHNHNDHNDHFLRLWEV